MKKNDKDLRLIGVVIAVVILAILILLIPRITQGEMNWKIGGIAIAVLLTAVIFYKRMYRQAKTGIPFKDERTNQILMISFAKAYLFSIWFILALSWFSDDIPFRDPSQALNYGIIGMAAIFGICWLWYRNKPNLDEVRL